MSDSSTDVTRLSGAEEDVDCEIGPITGCFPISEEERHINRGDEYLCSGDFGKAIADYTEAIQLAYDHVAYHRRGNAYNEIGEFEKAVADYTEAIRLERIRGIQDDMVADVYFDRAATYKNLGDTDKAVADYEEYLKAIEKYIRDNKIGENDDDTELAVLVNVKDVRVLQKIHYKEAQRIRPSGEAAKKAKEALEKLNI